MQQCKGLLANSVARSPLTITIPDELIRFVRLDWKHRENARNVAYVSFRCRREVAQVDCSQISILLSKAMNTSSRALTPFSNVRRRALSSL